MSQSGQLDVKSPEFKGAKKNQGLVEQAWRVFLMQGAFFSADAPISIRLVDLAEYLTQMGTKTDPKALGKAMDENDHIFAAEGSGDDVVYVTTRSGTPPSAGEDNEQSHDLQERFKVPEPPRERDLLRRSDRPTTLSESELEARSREAEYPEDSWQAAVAAALRDAGSEEESAVETRDASVEGEAERFDVSGLLGEVMPTKQEEEQPAGVDVEEQLVEETAVAAKPEATDEVIEESPVAVPETEIELVDIREATDEELRRAIEEALSQDDEIVRWGDTWMAEERVPRLSRGDIRRLQEFLGEAEGPLTDVDLVQDLRGILPNADEFETERFALNYRMSQESRHFEFVGTASVGRWTTTQLQPIGTDKRRASEIGQDYRFLLEYATPDPNLEEGIIEHVLTFYEYNLGVLPYDANFQTLLPAAAFDGQRATRLTFESPATYETFDIELRYPTGNRGGYLIGFERFFQDNLVPGAVLTIEATDDETHFVIEYFQMSRQDRKLLHFDTKRNKYVFKQSTYYCATQDEMLIEDNHFERLANVEPLSEGVKRNPDQVVAATFERIGERIQDGDAMKYRASFVDLLAVANVERPVSAALLKDILESGSNPEFQPDESEEDVYVYAPAKTE